MGTKITKICANQATDEAKEELANNFRHCHLQSQPGFLTLCNIILN